MKTVFAVFAASLMLLTGIHSSAQDKKGPLTETLTGSDKAALLMVHFGTSYDDTRSKTIDAINARAKEAFPGFEVREAYTSRIVIRVLKKRGTEKLTPLDALLKLRAEGFTHIVIQPTTLMDGVEMESIRSDAARMAPFFKEIRIGKPLLYSIEDCRKVSEIMAERLAAKADAKKRSHVVLVGHGTYTPATATYSQMDHIFKASGHTLFHVTTLEGYPTYDTVLAELKAAKAKKVTLVPFLFVAGDHASNDIAVEWKQALEAEGFEVECIMEGLGEIPEIQAVYLSNALACIGGGK